ncbi:hypothetical protein ACHHYP_13474 [Achlya hypogyna]|uniref:Secreted protein n=1 Tax=Achlya hypogyna TaxID=1202772 RepID=A0A0A7CPB5_ACHHY|nr:secreted protein [Achlya hypogyna]OQR84365.1 hypothetical protein ACHHYP_13474 [Achlya hypogyna]
MRCIYLLAAGLAHVAATSAASDIAKQLFDAHNQARQQNGLAPFECLDSQLSQLSADHVKYEVSIDDINHDGFGERCEQVGNVACGENTLYNYDGNAQGMTTQWMNSPGHRANILNGEYKHVGFAVEKGPSGKWFATAMFTDSNPHPNVCGGGNEPGPVAPTTTAPTPTKKPAPLPPTKKPTPFPPTKKPITKAPTPKPTEAPTEDPWSDDNSQDGSDDAPTEVPEASDINKQLFDAHNQARQKNGLKPFTCLNSKLSSLSMDHVDYEIRAGKISHDGFSGRCKQAGNNGACAENTLYNYDGNAQGMTTQWMNSAGHRANILNSAYNNVGFAVKKASDGKYYATAIFTQDKRACQ